MAPRIEQRTGFQQLVSPARWQGKRPRLPAEGPSRLGQGPDYETCASEVAVEEPASFSASFSALGRHPCMSTDQPSWPSRSLNLRERESVSEGDRRSHLSEIATGTSCHAGVCIIP